MINGDECIDDSEEYYNPLDDAPMFSSFSRTMQFVEPVYGLVKQGLEGGMAPNHAEAITKSAEW